MLYLLLIFLHWLLNPHLYLPFYGQVLSHFNETLRSSWRWGRKFQMHVSLRSYFYCIWTVKQTIKACAVMQGEKNNFRWRSHQNLTLDQTKRTKTISPYPTCCISFYPYCMHGWEYHPISGNWHQACQYSIPYIKLWKINFIEISEKRTIKNKILAV